MATDQRAASANQAKPNGRVAARALTEAGIRSLKAGQSRTDGALPVGNGRLIMTCSRVGRHLRRTWWFRVRKADQATEIVLGDHPAITLEEARQRAGRLIQLVREGANVREIVMDRPRRSAVDSSSPRVNSASLRALLTSYVESLRKAGKQSAGDVEALFARHVFEPWPELANASAASIEAAQIRDILARLVQMGIRRQTNVLRSYLQAAYTHGAHADLDPRRPDGAAARFKITGNPVAFVPRISDFEGTRDRVLSDDELRQVWNGLDHARLEVALTFRCAMLLGGQRFRQLLRATWDDYDEQHRVLTLQDPKGRRKTALAHRLPVSDRVAQMLGALRRFNGRGTYIFSANAGRSPIHTATLSIAFAAVRNGSERTNDAAAAMQARDLRRSIETRLQALGVDREVRAQLLSHGRTAGVQQQHYERHDFLPEKAAALALLESHLLSVIGSEARRPRRSSEPANTTAALDSEVRASRKRHHPKGNHGST